MTSKGDGHIHWMDQIFKEYEKTGELKNNPGHGKPLSKNLFKGSVYDNFVKTANEAGYVPPWLKLQKEVKELLIHLVHAIEMGAMESDIHQQLTAVNDKIKQYNYICPPQMQRTKIDLSTIDIQMKRWE